MITYYSNVTHIYNEIDTFLGRMTIEQNIMGMTSYHSKRQQSENTQTVWGECLMPYRDLSIYDILY